MGLVPFPSVLGAAGREEGTRMLCLCAHRTQGQRPWVTWRPCLSLPVTWLYWSPSPFCLLSVGPAEGFDDTLMPSAGHLDSVQVSTHGIRPGDGPGDHSFIPSFIPKSHSASRCQALLLGRCHTAGGSLVTDKGDVGPRTEGWTARRGSSERLHLGCPEA